MKRPVLVVGTGRCGTLTVTTYLQNAGLDIGHERERPDGTVAWYRAFPSKTDPYDGPLVQREYRTILHVVREPLATIASWAFTVRPLPFSFISQHLKLPQQWSGLRKALTHWVRWNERCEEISSWTFRIEDLPEKLPELYDRVGALNPFSGKPPKILTHERPHRSITWTELLAEDAELTVHAASMMKRYGYR